MLFRKCLHYVDLNHHTPEHCMYNRSVQFLAIRWFYSGLSEKELNRLKLANSCGSPLAGRDVYSDAFESRLRIVPLLSYKELYRKVDDSRYMAVQCHDPYSSSGNLLEVKHYHEGDDFARRVIEQKRKREQAALQRTQWNVLVVDPVTRDNIDKGILYPSPHPIYYQYWSDTDCTNNGINKYANKEEIRECGALRKPFPLEIRKELRENAHTSVINKCVKEEVELEWNESYNNILELYEHQKEEMERCTCISTTYQEKENHNEHTKKKLHTVNYFTALCLEPYLEEHFYKRQEAEVELITAYRNILYDAAELQEREGEKRRERSTWETSIDAYESSLEKEANNEESGAVDVLRIPVLGCYTANMPVLEDIAKITQRSVIKGFHRLDRMTREKLLLNSRFTVELYTPPSLYELFTRTFAEEAWPPPQNLFELPTVNYPGLPPPQTLLEYDGWVGKRPELIEAVETRGLSLLTKPQLCLDGTVVEKKEVLPEISPLTIEKNIKERIEKEKQTWLAQLKEPEERKSTVANTNLHSGLQSDTTQSEWTSMRKNVHSDDLQSRQ